MTIREHLVRKGRRMWFVFVPAWIAATVGGAMEQPWLIAPAFICFFGAVIYQLFALRCPACNGNLSVTVFNASGWPFGRKARFCPFCAVDLDAEIKDSPWQPLS